MTHERKKFWKGKSWQLYSLINEKHGRRGTKTSEKNKEKIRERSREREIKIMKQRKEEEKKLQEKRLSRLG